MCCKGTLVAVTVALAAMAATIAAGNEPITAANWQRHPAIVEIRAIYLKIEQAEKAGRLRKEEDACERTLFLDAKGVVRRYRVVRGSDDSAVDTSYYYDRDGALRFVLANAGAVNSTHYEYRIYLSKSGGRLWQEQRHLEGPGYPFPAELPDDWLVKDPKQAFAAAHPCE